MTPGSGGDVITIKIAGQPEGVSQGTPLEIERLVAQMGSLYRSVLARGGGERMPELMAAHSFVDRGGMK